MAQAARYCQGVNQTPTVDNIRQHLKTGSKSTIARYLRDWKENCEIDNAADGKIPEELQQLVRGLWERLQTQAEERIEQHHLEAKASIQALQQQLAQTQSEKRELEVNYHRSEERHHQANATHEQLQTQLIDEQQKNSLLAERLSAYETRHQEQITENERIHQLLKHIQQNLEHYQNAVQQQRQEQLLNQEKLQQEYEQRLTYAHQQLTLLTQEKSNYQAQYEQITPLYTELKNQYSTLTAEKQQLYEQYQNIFYTHQHMQELQHQSDHQMQELSAQLKTKIQTIINFEISAKKQENKMELLEKNLSISEDKLILLRHDYDIVFKEKSILEGQLKQLENTINPYNFERIKGVK